MLAAAPNVKANFGLTLPTDPDAAKAGKLLLTDYEVENLRKAYERTLGVGAEKFRGVFDNTEIYHKLAELTGVQ